MSNFSFLKTGTYNDKSYEETLLKKALSLYMVFTEDALRIAGTYTVHLGGKLVREDVILKSLKLRAYSMLWNQPGMQQRLKDAETELDELLEDEGNETMAVAEAPITQEMLDFKLKDDCSCELCKIFNEVDVKWATWEPQSDIDIRLKTMIDKAQKTVYG